MVEDRMQHLLNRVHAIDTQLRLVLDVPHSKKYKGDIEKLEADVAALAKRSRSLKRMITLSAMTDMNPDTPGGVIPPDNDDATANEWPGEEN